ncbi:DUF7146 domain-containing protein [Paenirhodobacter populi]|uniref:Uncharacterized protein n=1 Tax=Paenirhodobacter populi TaxID=2306993 RepID=A0A443J621_9RHOB|nr:toprim domain-containing protein [Sinirhodobacter populi]RWR15982.1 hypothetical protein D2T30_22645 [Sinirhodobacter populi]
MTEARRITHALQGRWCGRYGLCRCPAHNDHDPSLTVADAPDGRLLLRCHAGCDFLSILDALRGLGIVEGHGTIPRTDPAEMARPEAEERREAEKRAKQAQRCWAEALPIGGTIAETYLREARGITCPLPDTLRFHPQCWHGATARPLPAMVALVQGVAHFAVHRTFLQLDGSGKAGVQPDKMMLGNVTGGAVRVADGHDALAVAEGVETALSLPCGPLRGSVAVWAALSAGGMKALRLPSRPGTLIVATDGDEPGRASGAELAAKAGALGWTVTMLPAPEGADWNDVIRDPKGVRA